jgi:hypothetical protein
MAIDKEVEQCYQEFWKDIIEKPDGTIDVEQVKKELYDFRVMMREVRKVYDDVTGGKFSKPNTAAEHIIDAVNERIEKIVEDEIKDRAVAPDS